MVCSRQSQCTGKRRFETHKAAGQFLAWLRRRNADAKQMHPYKCPHCEQWHLGHKPTDPVALRHADLLRREDILAEEGSADPWEAEKALCKKR
jgi:hypothetical protein